jgi:hypothetical protein
MPRGRAERGQAMTGKPFDPLCYELAEHFLADELKEELRGDDAKTHLALQIQQLIEDEIEFMREMFPEENADELKP